MPLDDADKKFIGEAISEALKGNNAELEKRFVTGDAATKIVEQGLAKSLEGMKLDEKIAEAVGKLKPDDQSPATAAGRGPPPAACRGRRSHGPSASSAGGWRQCGLRARAPAPRRSTSCSHDASEDSNYKGSGLGLAITRGIVSEHGGRIWVESLLGRGATFSFALPLDQEPQTG